MTVMVGADREWKRVKDSLESVEVKWTESNRLQGEKKTYGDRGIRSLCAIKRCSISAKRFALNHPGNEKEESWMYRLAVLSWRSPWIHRTTCRRNLAKPEKHRLGTSFASYLRSLCIITTNLDILHLYSSISGISTLIVPLDFVGQVTPIGRDGPKNCEYSHRRLTLIFLKRFTCRILMKSKSFASVLVEVKSAPLPRLPQRSDHWVW
jgi:hypothetical protein